MPATPPINWVEKLSKIDMPILSAVVRQLNQLTGDDDAEVNQLAEVILKDPHMTSQILKVANSVQYNPINTSISTVSRAIVLLGFQGVRSLCISLMVVDSLLNDKPRDRLLETMAKAFHAAVLARAMYKQVDKKNHEEVFIATLLYHLGEMAFWAYGGQTADDLEVAESDCKTIEKTIGTSFNNLSKELGKVWRLGNTLQEALDIKGKKSEKSQAVLLGDAFSQSDLNDKSTQKELMKKIASFTGQSLADTKQLINESAEKAAVVAIEFGAAKVCHLIPGYKDVSKINVSPQEATVIEADTSLQLKVLRDMASAIADADLDVTTVFQMALEGMHRGIGLERVALAFFRQNNLQLKYVLGESTEGWRQDFVFDTAQGQENLFAEVVNRPQPMWLDESYFKKNQYLLDDKIKTLLGVKPAFVGVLRINHRNAALFYADRGHTKEGLSIEQFDAFKHFLSQCELSVQAMADKRQKLSQ